MAHGYRIGLRDSRLSYTPNGGKSWEDSKPEKKTRGDKMTTVFNIWSAVLWKRVSKYSSEPTELGLREMIVKFLKIMAV